MSLSNIFIPKSIAIIGASEQVGSVGNSILANLINGFEGLIYPINPKYTQINSLACYPSILDLQCIPDLVVIAIPSKFVEIILNQCVSKGVKGVVIISAGFKETGIEGIALEAKIKEICIANNITLIGPNCLGVINPWINMNASFANSVPPKGNIAFVSQSGAICTAIIDYAQSLGLGFSKFVSVGNKALCGEVELLKYLEDDEQTQVIAIYAESLIDASLIIGTMKSITKPVIILKSGRTLDGSGASSSHTGALASEDILYQTLFRQAGMIPADTIQELFNYMQILSRYPDYYASSKNKLNIAIVTNAGGPGVLTTDFIIQNGMKLAKINQGSIDKLKLVLPPTANFHNPFDVIGDAPAQRFKDALEVLTKDASVDALIVILTPQSTTEIDQTASIISDFVYNSKKPIITSFIGADKVISGINILRQNQVVHIAFPENAARALGVFNFQTSKQLLPISKQPDIINLFQSNLGNKQKVQEIFDQYRSKKQFYIPEADAKQIFELYGIPMVKSVFCRNLDEVQNIAHNSVFKNFKSKLILKIISQDIMHKSDVGGIKADVELENVENEFMAMMELVQYNLPSANIQGVLFSEMVDLSAGVEFILGAKKDYSLGMSIMFGIGGTMVELINDVVFGFGKLEEEDILKMLSQLQSKKIIQGYRGKSPLDQSAIILIIKNLSQLLLDFPNIVEVDMNPVLVSYNSSGAKTLDAKIVFE